MSTTTYAAILDAFNAALEARVPTNRTDMRFHRYQGDEFDFGDACELAGEGAFRLFNLEHMFDTETVGPFDLLAYTVVHAVQLVVGYPIASMRYGATSDARGDRLIHADSFDLNKAIGQPAVATGGVWPAGMHDCRWVQTGIEDRGQLRLLRLTFRLNYQESNPS
jgi:hypothetical protein